MPPVKRQATMKKPKADTAPAEVVPDLAGPFAGKGSGIFGRKICGDLFGATSNMNMDGMLYKSRVLPGGGAQEHAAVAVYDAPGEGEAGDEDGLGDDGFFDPDGVLVKARASEGATPAGGRRLSTSRGGPNDDDEEVNEDLEDEDEELVANLGVRQRVALTLKNWCIDEGNTTLLLKEGAVATLVVLAGLDDPRVRRYCALAFHHLAMKRPHRRALLREGMMTAVLQLCNALQQAGPGAMPGSAAERLSLKHIS